MSECCEGSETPKMTAALTLKNIFSSNPKWEPERNLIIFTGIAVVSLLIILLVMSMTLFSQIPNFKEIYFPLLALSAIICAIITGCGYHFLAYKKPVPCSIGMMEGMSFGMMAGFLIGALIGATNGMFWGSIVAMVASSIIGVWAGKCCGVMGVIEGLMAGIMGGTMGAMLSVMLLAEPLPIFLALLTFMCSIVLIALAYMRIVEYGELGTNTRIESPISMTSTALIFFILLTLFMVYGPKSGPVWGL